MSSGFIQREVQNSWYVSYEEMSFPAVQKGMILSPERWEKMDPFILMAEDWFKRGTFSDHPHRGFQTITYVIDGRLEHIDNSGGHGILEAGDVQYMNAGWAARHAEEAVADDIAHTLQLWLNLPQNLKQTETSYQDIYYENAPEFPFNGGKVKVYSGEVHGVKGPLKSLVPITLSEVSLSKGSEYSHVIPEKHNAFLYVLSGELIIGNEHKSLKKTGVAHLTYAEKQSELRIRADERSKVLIYSGEAIKEKMVAYGPFVMNTMDEVRQAFRDYQQGKFGPPAE